MSVSVLLDVDGTLVDSNYQHAIAWYRAFREHDLAPPKSVANFLFAVYSPAGFFM